MISIRKKKRKNKTTLYLDISINGFRRWERLDLFLTGNKSLDKKILEQAEKIRAKRLIEISESKYGLTSASYSNNNFLSFYKKVIDERPEYERCVSIYKHLAEYSKLKNLRLNFLDINESFWISFKRYLIDECKYKQTTVATSLGIIKAILNRAVRENKAARNPLGDVKEKRPKSNRTYLTFNELKLLNEAYCENDIVKRAFLFSCYTGIRKGDVKKLRKIDLLSDSSIKFNVQKNDNDLSVPYDYKALKFIPNFDKLGNDDLLFKLPADSTIHAALREWTARAGINKKVTYHTSRHTFATLYLAYGGNIMALRDILGHGDVKTTQIYAKVVDEIRRDGIKNLPEL